MNALDEARLAAGDVASEAIALRRCVRDLVAMSTLPAAWAHSSPIEIVESLSEVVLRILMLDLAYVSVPLAGGTVLEAGRTRRRAGQAGRGSELGRSLMSQLGTAGLVSARAIRDPDDGEPLRASASPVGYDRDCGWLVAASRRADFPTADEQLLLSVAANQLALVLQRKSAEELLRDEARTLETLNRIGVTLAGELNLEPLVQQVTDAATQVCGAQFGAFFYNVQNQDGEFYQLYALSGLSREMFNKFPYPRNTAVFAPTFAGTEIVRSDDIRKDPRYGQNSPYRGTPPGHAPVVSYLAVPVISRSKEVIGGLFFGHPQPGVFSERAARLVAAIAAQAAIAIDNARLYERVRDSAERLAESDRRKDEFLATLAHELRNPLAPMRNALKLMQLTPGQPEIVVKAQGMMRRQLEHMVRLVDDLLDLSRISRGKIELQRAPVELAAVVRAAIETVQHRIEQADHVLQVALPPEPIVVSGDVVRLAQVFSNLLNNAAKFTGKGGRLTLAATTRGTDVEVCVRDNGIGIPADKLPYVFDMFTQVDSSLAKLHGGLGIGLAIVKCLVELHGGRVEARSAGAGCGSEFIVCLPLAAPAALTPVPATHVAKEVATRHRCILIVDDNPDAAMSLAMVLEALGHEVHSAGDGAAALAAIEKTRFDLVFLDIGLPGMSGFDVCQRMRARLDDQSVTFVAISGWGQEQYKARARAAGFDHYFIKPVDPEALQSLLREPLKIPSPSGRGLG